MNDAALFLHLVCAVVWIGGMFFAYVCLRPAAAEHLQPPQRLTLWAHTLARFFPWVWVAIIVLPVSGYGMLFAMGGFQAAGSHIHIMQAIGIIMIALFLHVYFAPFARLKKLVSAGDFPAAARHLNQIRRLVAINLTLGIIVLVTVRLLR